MMHKSLRFWGFGLWLACLVLLFPQSSAAHAQATQCGVASSVSFPVDPNAFELGQDFAAPSVRHQGRYHTAEDWTLREGSSYGQPVRAIADGRVTFSSANGWGRDGGVIILEHVFADGSTFYSQYGHLTDATGTAFPAVFSCVAAGEIIAAIGDPRPAPHLHLEVRTNTPDLPGPGYTWENPAALGLRRPSKFITNQNLWAQDFHAWHLDLGDETGPGSAPARQADGGLVYLDNDRVSLASPDGRVLWRLNLTEPAAGLLEAGDNSGAQIVYRSGRVQAVNAAGELGASSELGTPVARVMVAEGGSGARLPMLYTPDRRLLAFDPLTLAVRWTVDDVDEPVRVILGENETLGVVTRGREGNGALLVLNRDTGVTADRASLAEPGGISTGATGLLAYTRGGAWRIDQGGVWSLLFPDVPDLPPGGSRAAIHESAAGLALYDGAALLFLAPDGTRLWSADAPDTAANATAPATLEAVGENLLLITGDGHIAAYRARDGGLCNQTQVWADWRAGIWHELGSDGLLRLHAADQLVALDWETFLLACG